MKLTTAIELLQRIAKHAGSRLDDMTLSLVVHSPSNVGGTPTVAIESIHAGIDWDASKVMLFANKEVTTLSKDDVQAITESVRMGQSWHAYQSYKKQQKRIEDLTSLLQSNNIEIPL